jgi:DNA polymerase I
MDNIYNNDLIFGKNNLQNIVSIEPGNDNNCILFVQYDDEIKKVKVDMSHWILYTEKHSDKMVELKGNQPYKYLMQYDNIYKHQDILKQSRDKKLDVYVPKDQKEAFMMLNGYTYYKGLKVKDVSILSFDLEHTYGIGEVPKQDGKLLLISNTYRDYKGNIKKRLFSYDEFKNEGEMLEEWCEFVRDCDPSIIVGHNIFGHDFKILRHSSKVNKSKLKLGRNNSELKFDYKKSLKRKDGSQAYDYFNVLCYGREIVDTFFLALNYDIGRNYESYGLKAIMKHEKLEKTDRTHYDASKIITNYLIEEEWLKIKEYAKDDADDSLALFDLMIPSFFYYTQSIPRSLQYIINSATGSQINSMMIRGYLQQGHSISKASDSVDFEGGLSGGAPGIYKNVFKIDCQSLYPSIIRQYNIYSRDKDEQKLFLNMVEYFTLERLKNKKLGKETGNRYYKDLEQSQKIAINSMFGFLGANKLNYNYPLGAAQITRYGREILLHAVKWLTGSDNINIDKDKELDEQI